MQKMHWKFLSCEVLVNAAPASHPTACIAYLNLALFYDAQARRTAPLHQMGCRGHGAGA